MCTRVLYTGLENRVLTGRSMDWKVDVGTNLWVFPKGMERHGSAGPTSLTWTSTYGSVIAGGYDLATTDGLNEAGLCANVLWLVESSYPDPLTSAGKPLLSIAAWCQYVLDNFATVAEAVEALAAETFLVVTDAVPGEDRKATMHLSMSDAGGDSAILEYIDGELVIHHDPSYKVMTNSPAYDQQLAINSYWSTVEGMLPGTNRAADRFARANFYVDAVPKVSDRRAAAAEVFSVMRNVSVPLGISTPNEPNISSTRWRTVADHLDLVYYFDSATSPALWWVELGKVDLSEGAPSRRLDLKKCEADLDFGDVSLDFTDAEPFTFAGLPTA